MSLHRFFVTGPLSAGRVTVGGADLHHLRDVLRMRPGDEVAVSDGAGAQAVARIAAVTADAAELDVVRMLPDMFEPDVTLVLGLSRGQKMDLAVQKATEIGVRAILPVVMARSVVRPDGDDAARRAARWRRIAAEAAKQSQRATVPHVGDTLAFAGLADALASFDAVLVFWEETGAAGVRDVLRAAGVTGSSRVAVVVGPEGGIQADEVERLTEAGALVVSLGATILRTETAAIVGTALVIHELGGLGGVRP